MEDGVLEVWQTSVLHRPERSGDLEPWVQGTLRYGKRKASGFHLRLFFFTCGRWDLNPHVVTHTRT